MICRARLRRHLFVLACCLAALLLQSAQASPAASKKHQLRDLRDRIEALKKELADAEESKSEAADALKESEHSISDINRRLFDLAREQRDTRANLAELQTQARSNEGAIAEQQQRLNSLLYQQYTAGAPDGLRLLLSGESPDQTARDLSYYGYIARARSDLLLSLHGRLFNLRKMSRAAQEKQTQLAAIEAEQTTQKQRLEQQQQSRKQVLTKLSRQIGEQRRQIATLQRNEKRLTRLIERLAKILASKPKPKPQQRGRKLRNEALPDAGSDGGAFQQLKGKLNLPVRGELANRFGSPRSDSGVIWKGLFIVANSGDAVKAVASGQVVFADWLRGFGNILILDHGQGYMSLYGNNESLYKQVGDTVQVGDAIATVGNSGGNGNSGLYFELRHQGKPFDPLSWITLR